ncbi:MAG: 1-deoxy-D-xylulose-5-phosphate synthase [Lachnospiraceae bacterium]|nr:1-deoxy-D-xylulose-5-phosphate synthase [Lachnospiraceae bacterium]
MILENIRGPRDVKELPAEQLPLLASEVRDFLIEHVSETGGHLASNLGVVELTIALHRVLDLPQDKLVWDVGHQSYTHKLLTGRREAFDTLRKEGGLSGFPKHSESACDAFDTGHSSTSVSAALGLAAARDLRGGTETVAAVIGDGALTGGMAFEALNNAGRLKSNLIIVLNDNEMSISHNIGGISRYLSGLRTSTRYTGLKLKVEGGLEKTPVIGKPMIRSIRRTKSSLKALLVPGMFFEDMGITYLGPVDGYDFKTMTRVLREAKRYPGAVLVHVKTVKGKGYAPAEKNPSFFHGIGPFEPATGLCRKENAHNTYSDVFSDWIMKKAEERKDLVAVTAAMPEGTGLSEFKKKYPGRFFDVGIAEEHAVTFSAGMAAGGLLPVVAVYSSFLQRAYDQIVHDVCINRRHVIFAVDRAGLVGADGETHQGILDLSFLASVPGLAVMAPRDARELKAMLGFAAELDGPAAVRYPRGKAQVDMDIDRAPIQLGVSELRMGEMSGMADVSFFAAGTMVKEAMEAARLLKAEGRSVRVVNARFIDPLDEKMIRFLAENSRLLVTMEENVIRGGMGEAAAALCASEVPGTRVLTLALPDAYVPQGNAEAQKSAFGLDAQGAAARVREVLG